MRLTVQSIFCVMKKATFAVCLVQIAEFPQKINISRSTPHLDQPGSHVTVNVMVNLKPCSYELAYVSLTSTEVSSRSIVGTKPAKLQHVLSTKRLHKCYSKVWLTKLFKGSLLLHHPMDWLNEPAHEIMALFVLRKFILQTHMRSHPVGLDVWFLVGPFVYFHTSDPQARLSLRWLPMW